MEKTTSGDSDSDHHWEQARRKAEGARHQPLIHSGPGYTLTVRKEGKEKEKGKNCERVRQLPKKILDMGQCEKQHKNKSMVNMDRDSIIKGRGILLGNFNTNT